MRTLREIDNEIYAQSKTHAETLCNETNPFMGITFNEIVAVQVNIRVCDKFREMYHLLTEIESHLNQKFEGPTAGWDEETAKKALLKKISQV